ncbi:nucleoside deaminase [Brachyspira pilosicoli]|uniref:nucleoside deaminase n=1 Tax=Brachyspira pilosicoli TaxID=52584 RepID=UPI0030043BA8
MEKIEREKHIFYLREAIKESILAKEAGNTPFGAVMVDKNGNIILRQQNIEITEHDCTGHAETAIMRAASKLYDRKFLWDCTLYTTFEPCAMCCGAIYWGNVGTVVYGLEEKTLLKLTGDNEQNPTFDLPSREIIKAGQKDIKILGPFEELTDEIIEPHIGYWK